MGGLVLHSLSDQLLFAISAALDLTYKGISPHHMRVALVTGKISQALGLPRERLQCAVRAALIHDCGVKTWGERDKLHVFEVEHPFRHAEDGFRLLEPSPLCTLAGVVRHHHDRWSGGNYSGLAGESIPLESRILHLADRLDVLLDPARFYNCQRSEVLKGLEGYRGSAFDPQLVDVLGDIGRQESFWLDLEPEFLRDSLVGFLAATPKPASQRETCGSIPELGEIEGVAEVFAGIVDRRSPYTYQHSKRVADCAYQLGKVLGFDENRCRELRVAGLLHDLGKLGVDEGILDKNGSLDGAEVCVIRRHPYLTFRLLERVSGFEELKEWAAFHHERLDGKGYPFGFGEDRLSLEARVVAVCDVFAALSEDRPYRRGLERDRVMETLEKMADSGALDRKVVEAAGCL